MSFNCVPEPSILGQWQIRSSSQDEVAEVEALEAKLYAKLSCIRNAAAPVPIGAAIAARIQREREEAEEAAANAAMQAAGGEATDDGGDQFGAADFQVDDDGMDMMEHFGEIEDDNGTGSGTAGEGTEFLM